MISVIIPTRESERLLVRTLACLVPGATAGLIREVILADAGSTDETASVGDVAGCRFLALPGPAGARLAATAAQARSDWLMFVVPGALLEESWVGEARHFIETAELHRVAVFRRVAVGQSQASAAAELLALLAAALGARPKPEQGLLIAKSRYRELGGHRAAAADPERELLRRLPRSAIVRLRSGIALSRV
ncbi:MAG: glycosyltransferase [Pseudorhodoplanes sp.]|nr:glycosyltransferase [Pseudorhodoplanes sp.]